MNTIVIRLSSLGDVVLAGSITEKLAPVTFITKKQYHPIAKQLAGVTTVLSPGDTLPTQAKKVVDLQRNVTSRRLAKAINAPTFAVDKRRWQQWQRVIWKSKKRIV